MPVKWATARSTYLHEVWGRRMDFPLELNGPRLEGGIPHTGPEGQQLESPGSRTGAGHRQADPVAQDQTAQHPAAQGRRQILPIKDRPARRALLARPEPNRLSDHPFSESKVCRFPNRDIRRV